MIGLKGNRPSGVFPIRITVWEGLTQELMSLSLRDLERMVNKYCDSPRLSKLFISWSGCGNRALNDTVKHWQQYVLYLDRINQEKERIPNDEKMPLICWSVIVRQYFLDNYY